MSVFRFRQFIVRQESSAMKVGTDSMLLGALIDASEKSRALDIGTGTGVLSLMIAQKNPQLRLTAVEIEEQAFREAQHNFRESPFANRIEAVHTDFRTFEPLETYDLIFSNPPYFEKSFRPADNSRFLARHDDGLPLEDLFRKTASLLEERGCFWLILPAMTMDQWYPSAEKYGLYALKEIAVYGKPGLLSRKIAVFSKTKTTCFGEELIVRDASGKYTEAYKILTKDYHSHLPIK